MKNYIKQLEEIKEKYKNATEQTKETKRILDECEVLRMKIELFINR